jgi:hypothetical protein
VTQPPVEHVRRRDTAPDRRQAGLHLGDHARGQGREQLLQVVGVELADHLVRGRPVEVEALHVGEHDQLGGAQRDRQGRRGGVGVDVVDRALGAARDAGDDGDAPVRQQRVDHRRVDLDDLPDEADVHRASVHHGQLALGGEQVGVLARQPDRERAVPVDQADDVLVDLAVEHHADHVDGLFRRDPKARGEPRGDPEPLQVVGDLRAAAVHDHRADPGVPQEHQILREPGAQLLGGHRVTAVLDHHGLAAEPVKPGQRLDQGGRLRGRRRPPRGVLPAGDDDRHVEYAEFSWT